jgi:hypothetical protein
MEWKGIGVLEHGCYGGGLRSVAQCYFVCGEPE